MGQVTLHPTRQIFLFGALRLYQDGSRISLTGEKCQSLLAYLVMNGPIPHTREQLSDLLYPNAPFDRVRRNFSDTLYRLKKKLGENWLVINRDTVALHINEQLWVDVWEFDLLVGSVEEADLQRACKLYSGDLLPELYDDWLISERELRRNQYLSLLEKLAAIQEGRGDLGAALLTLRRLVSAEPLHEPAHQSYLRLLGRLRRYGEAQAHFDYLRNLLRTELESDPLAETTAIAQAIERERALATVEPFVEEHTPFVGRKKERAEVLSAVEAMLNGQGVIYAIEGEAGIGKSRLLREITSGIRWRGATFLLGAASETPSTSPLSPLVEALAPLMSSPRGMQLETLLSDEIRVALAPLYPEWAKKIDLVEVPKELAANRFNDALRSLGGTLAQLMPIVLAFDDMHWADPALWKSLEAIAEALLMKGSMLILLYRRPEIENTPGWELIRAWDRAGYLTTISLQALTIEDVAQLTVESSTVDPVEIHAWSGGNPFLVNEFLIAPDPRNSNFAQTTVHRLERLSPNSRVSLESASVVGENIPYKLWAHIVDDSPIKLASISEELSLQHWLEPTPAGYTFLHDLVREAVYAQISPTKQQKIHKRTALAYIEFDPENYRARAFHFDKAGLRAEAAAAYHHAGEQDLERYAFYEAANAFSRAIELLPARRTQAQIELFLALGQTCEFIGDRGRQTPALNEALLRARKLGDPNLLLQALIISAKAATSTNQNTEAFTFLSEALSLAHQLQDHTSEAEVLLYYGRNETNLMHTSAAKAHYLNALNLAMKSSDLSRQAQALRGLGIAARDIGDPHKSIKWLNQALTIHRQIGDTVGAVVTQANLITAYFDLATWDRVLSTADQVLVEADRFSLRSVAAYARQVKALACYSLGDFQTAQAIFLQVELDYLAVGDQRGAALAHDSLGLVAEAENRYTEALHYYQNALEMIQSVEGATENPIVQHDLGALLLKMEREAEALPWLKAAYTGWHGSEDELARLKSGAFLGLAYLSNGERTKAEKLAFEGWRAFQRGIPDGEMPQGWLWGLYLLLTDLEQLPAAQAVFAVAHAELHRQAQAISDEGLRQSFFERVPVNQSIIETYDHQHTTTRVLVFRLAHKDAPLGRELRDEEFIQVKWTISAPEDEAIANKIERRQHRLKRLLKQAENQNAAPTDEDLAKALGVSRRTILRDMRTLEAERTHTPTRRRKE